jgi:hypothetical protein
MPKWNPWEWLKWFYDVAGHKNPILSACGIIFIFALGGLLVWWRLDAQYRKDHPTVAATASIPSRAADVGSPAPIPPTTISNNNSTPKQNAAPTKAARKTKSDSSGKSREEEGPVDTENRNEPPALHPTVVVNQDNREPSDTNIGYVDKLYQQQPALILSQKQESIAIQHLRDSPGAVYLVLPSPVPNMADGRTNTLGHQVLEIFANAGWSRDGQILGTGSVLPGITVVGDQRNEVVQRVVRAFEAAKIPYKLEPSGPPFSMRSAASVVVTVSRE